MSYPPAKFAGADRDAALEIARATRFATLAAVHDGALLTVHLPLTVASEAADGRAILVGHLLRNNPLFLAMREAPVAVRAMFVPAHGYVSPAVYPEKGASGKVVPTWNYVAAHLDGVAELADGDGLRDILEAQAADYEGATGGDWRVADAPADFVDGLARAIAGFRMTATGFLAIRKLSQNRPETDRAAVTGWLARTRPRSGDISWWMDQQEQRKETR